MNMVMCIEEKIENLLGILRILMWNFVILMVILIFIDFFEWLSFVIEYVFIVKGYSEKNKVKGVCLLVKKV